MKQLLALVDCERQRPVTLNFYTDGKLRTQLGYGPTVCITPDNRLLLGAGHIVQTYADDATNTLTSESHVGHWTDLCATLSLPPRAVPPDPRPGSSRQVGPGGLDPPTS